MAVSFIQKKQRIFAEARKKEAKPALKKLAEALKNFNRLEAADKADLKELVDAVYFKFVTDANKKAGTDKPTKKPSRSISQILKDFKAKIGAEKYREATRGTDIYRDMERPALKKGKRIVRKKGKTSNQYGTFKNKVGGTYYENRTNRSDVNQPSDKRYPKLEEGGMMFAGGGRTGKKRLKRRKITRQNANYDKKADSGLVGKPQGHRFTDKLAKRLGKPSYAKPTQEQIEKYRGKGVYSENRQDKSDVKPNLNYPSLGNGGMMFAKGGLLEKIKNSDTISEKVINQLKRMRIRRRRDPYFWEVIHYYHKVGFPRLDAEQTKKEYDFLMNLWKSPTGKVATNNPFSESEQKVLEDFSHFKFDGFAGDNPVYRAVAKNGSSFEYYHSAGSIKIDRRKVGQYGGGGRTGKKRLKRKKVTRQNPNYDRKADSGLVAKPQGHRFTDKLAKRLGKKSYAKPTQEQIEKYRGKGVYSENRQDKSDVKPNSNYPSL